MTVGVLLLCVACDGNRTVTPVDSGGPPDLMAPTPGQPVDILFVIDNTGSTESERLTLWENVHHLFEGLRSATTGKLPSLHVGVISTDLGAGNYGLQTCEVVGGDGGKLLSTPRIAACQPPTGSFIRFEEGQQINVLGVEPTIAALREAYGCISMLGDGGCAFEMYLESARRALDPKRKVNPGFLRPGAALLVVFIGTEDDCSARNLELFDPAQHGLNDPLGPLTSFRCFEFGIRCDINDRHTLGPRKGCVPAYDWLYRVEDYIKFFAGLGRPVAMAGLLGPREPVAVGKDGKNPWVEASCQGANGVAAPALRLHAVMDAFPHVSGAACEPAKFKDMLRAAAKLLNP